MTAARPTRPAPAAQSWLWDLRTPPPEPSATLVLLPHSGGSAQGYADWVRWFPEHIRLLGAQYPGRGPRFREPPVRTMRALADPLAEVLAGIDGSLSVFGHSLGALLGFEICWRLERAGRPPATLFASAAAAPHIHRPDPLEPHALSDDRLAALLRSRDGLPDVILEHPDLLSLVLGACRADIAVTESYRYGAGTRLLRCPVVVFGGNSDAAMPVHRLARWTEVSAGGAELHVLPGGHFYLHDQMASVAATIRARLPDAPAAHPRQGGPTR